MRSLAQRSAEAAKEFKALIQTSVEQVQSGSAVVGRARETIDRVVSDTGRVGHLIGEIANGAKEQSIGVELVGHTAQELDRSTQSNAALVEQTAGACEDLRLRGCPPMRGGRRWAKALPVPVSLISTRRWTRTAPGR